MLQVAPPMIPDRVKRSGRWERGILSLLRTNEAPLDFRILGRSLFHAALVGAMAGLIGAGFFAGLEFIQRFLLEDLAGYVMLRAHGETFVGVSGPTTFRPWLLFVLPGAGALLAGLVSRIAPETRGGGGDAMIHAFHHEDGVVRRRVIGIKALASFLTLGTGGSGGREGPTMQIGAALGSTIGRYLKVTARERRILMVAGVAAGMAAVFRTPLGAALLAVEVLYRDDFESDALVPAVLSSVIAYSVVISIYGETTLFARAPRYPFHAGHLPLYGLLAILVAIVAALFVATLRGVQRLSARLPVPDWVRPGIGGIALGVLAVPVILFVGSRIGIPGQGLGLLGGGYGAAQTAITGMDWLPGGWRGAELLLLLCFAKLLASSFTIGTGGSAGDFAPSLVIGGIFGGAFGRLAQLLLHDPSIDPGAFALVGMGTFYGGIAHVPISSLILVSELAGSYDLLVPLMLAEGIAFVALRNRTLYEAQLPTKMDSPAHGAIKLPEALRSIRVADVMTKDKAFITLELAARMSDVVRRIPSDTWQDSFPVLDTEGKIRGLITVDALRLLISEGDGLHWTIAADLMQNAVSVRPEDDLQTAAKAMLANGLREVPVVAESGAIVGFLDEAETAKAYVDAAGTVKERKGR
jgi:CIC family chloride channel protein